MKHTTPATLIMAAALGLAAIPSASDASRYVAHGRLVSGPAAVRVWVEGGDVFPDYSGVTLWVRPERDCYTSLFLVDTAGFIHVLDAGHDDGWLVGGRAYSYRARDLGLDRLDGRGIAYVFAVGSPMPFDYSYYGAAVHVGAFGFRIVGDPFVGGREFYMSLLPAACRWDYVNVSFTRFYVREWVRYPSYLCTGGHVRVGDWCRHCEPVYATYRCNVAAPYEAIRPVTRFKDRTRYAGSDRSVVRSVDTREPRRYEPIMPAKMETTYTSRDVESHESVRATPTGGRVKTREITRVVSTSREIARNAFEKSRPAPAMREQAAGGKKIAARGRDQKHTVLAQNARAKGAARNVREAE